MGTDVDRKRHGCRRWGCGCAASAALLAVLATLLVAWGSPLAWLAGRGSGGLLTFSGLRLMPHIEARDLRLGPPGALDPVLTVDSLRVDYALRPSDARRFGRVTVDRPRLVVDVRVPEAPNYQTLLPQTGTTASSDAAWRWPDLTWIPRELRVTDAALRGRATRGEVLLEGLGLSVDLVSWSQGQVALRADPLSVSWRLAGEPEWSVATGPLTLDAESLDGTHHLQARADLTGLSADLLATARHTLEGGAAEVTVNHLRLDTWTDALAQLSPVPLGVEAFQIEDSALSLTWSGAESTLNDARVSARITGFHAGSRATTGWSLGTAEAGQAPLDASVAGTVHRDGATYQIEARAEAGTLADGRVAGWVRQDAGETILDLSVPEGTLSGTVMNALPDGSLPEDLRFGTATLREARIAGTLGAGHADLDALQAAFQLDGVALGDLEIPPAAAPLVDLIAPHAELTVNADRVRVSPKEVALSGIVALGEAVRVEGRFEAQQEALDWQVAGDLRSLALDGPAWGAAIAAQSPVPLALDGLTLRDAVLRGTLAGAASRFDTARFSLAVPGLRIGPANTPWYAGSPTLDFDGTLQLFVVDGRATLQTAAGQQVTLRGKAGPAGADLEFSLDSGPRPTWSAQVPAAYRPWLDYAPLLARAEATGRLHSDPDGVGMDAVLTPHLASGADLRVALDATLPPGRLADGTPLPWPTGLPTALQARLEATLDAAWLHVDTHLRPDGKHSASANFGELEPAAVLRSWLGGEPLPEVGGSLAGSLGLRAAPAGPYQVEAQAQWSTPRLLDFSLAAPVDLEVRGQLAGTLDRLDDASMMLAMDGDSRASLSRLNVDTTPLGASGTLEVEIGPALLDAVFGYLGYEAPVSRVAGTAPFEANPVRVVAQPVLTVHSPWIAEAGLPAALPLNLAMGDLRLDLPGRAATATTVHAEVAEKLWLELPAIQVAWEEAGPVAAIPSAHLRLAALPFYRWFFDEAVLQGEATLTDFAYAGGVPTGRIALDVTADTLVLSGGLAKLHGATLTGDFAFVPAPDPPGPLGPWVLAGQGTLRVASATSGGLTATDLVAAVALDPAGLRLDITDGRIYDGAVTGAITVDLSRDTFRTRADVHFSGADLATFTREFQPPQVKLTGLARGTVGVEVDRYGVLDVSGQLESTEHFTMNRDLVQRLLMYDQVAGIYGGKQVSRAIDRVLGEDPQRPFDRANVVLRYEGAWLTLEADLRSKAAHTLNIDVDTTLDPLNLYRFLSEQQAAAIGGLDSLDRGL